MSIVFVVLISCLLWLSGGLSDHFHFNLCVERSYKNISVYIKIFFLEHKHYTV